MDCGVCFADFGVPLINEANSSSSSSPHKINNKLDGGSNKAKISIANLVKKQDKVKSSMPLEEVQNNMNKENENPQKDSSSTTAEVKKERSSCESIRYTPEEDAMYAQVNARLEPEGESRDTEDESERLFVKPDPIIKGLLAPPSSVSEDEKLLYSFPKIRRPGDEAGYSVIKAASSSHISNGNNDNKANDPEALYVAIIKSKLNKKNKFLKPDEVLDVTDLQKEMNKVYMTLCEGTNYFPSVKCWGWNSV